MNLFAILVHLFGASFAIPLVAQRLLSASNSNEVLLGLVNTNIPQGGAMNLLVPGMYQSQLQQKIAGLPQAPFGTRTGLTAQLPNQMMSYVVAYGIPQKQGQIQLFPQYPVQQQPALTAPKQLGNPSPTEQTFGCLVPQFNGEVVMPSSGLQLPTKHMDDHLFFNENPTPGPTNQEDKAAMDVLKAP